MQLRLLVKEQGALSPLVYEIGRKIKVLLLSGRVEKTDERHLKNRMAGITVRLPFPRTNRPRGAVHRPPRYIQIGVFAGGRRIGDRALHKVPKAVQLMVVLQVGKAFLYVSKNIEGIDVAVIHLRRSYQADGLISLLFQRRVAMPGQRVCDRLQPLVEIAVLKDEAAMSLAGGKAFFAVLQHFCSEPEILYAAARLSPRNQIVQRLPLIGNHLRADGLHLGEPELIRYAGASGRKHRHYLIHSIYLDYNNSLPGTRHRLRTGLL